jgi:hypothetical protein
MLHTIGARPFLWTPPRRGGSALLKIPSETLAWPPSLRLRPFPVIFECRLLTPFHALAPMQRVS